ncbi:MAG TPA: hypothetical protein PLF51_03455 [Candidatus Hydrogenedentes bacterium]|nr:hypothetical protein [Candidatus Hydrogenedentota bacterium]
MIAFSCPKCGHQFNVPDSAVGQHGWCRGCGTIIRVPESSNASEEQIADARVDPQVQALLRRVVAQLKGYRERAKRAEAELRTMQHMGESVAAQERALKKAETLASQLAGQVSAFKKEHQETGAELRESLTALRGWLAPDSPLRALGASAHEPGAAEELRADLQRERTAHAAARAQVHDLKARLAAATKESEGRGEEVNRLGERLARFEQRTAELAERCGKLEEQAGALRRERDEARRILETRNVAKQQSETVAARLQEKETTIQRLSEELRLALERKGEAEAVGRQHLDDIEHLSAELSGVTQSAEAEILEIQAELRGEREAHLLAERALVTAHEELRVQRQELDAFRKIEAEHHGLKREAALLRESLERAGEGPARTEGADEALRAAWERIRELETELVHLRTGLQNAPEIGAGMAEPGEDDPSRKDGPFPGPFVAPSEQKTDVQGIKLIPETMDENLDDHDMLDTLMRLLGAQE